MTTVLVADDSATVRDHVGTLLRANGFSVIDAADGRAALELTQQVRPDVVLLDLEMPELDGHDVLRAMRADPDLSVIPVVVLTAHERVEDLVAALHHGGHDYVRKPFEPEELVARVRAAARTSAMAHELRRRNRELDEFTVRATHDLKSPLSVVIGMAETLAERGSELPEERRVDLLRRIAVAARRAARMVSDLLDLARAGSGGADDVESSDPLELARAVVADVGVAAEATVDGTWAPVAVPRVALTSVLTNLIANASIYGRDEQGRLELFVRAWPTTDALHVVVEDRGHGVDLEDAPHLFEPFYKSSHSTDVNPNSTGVGLAIVARTIERWGGSITVEAASPHGAAFHLVLPLAGE